MNKEEIDNLSNVRLAFEKLLKEIRTYTSADDSINIKVDVHTANDETYARRRLNQIIRGMSGEIKHWKHYPNENSSLVSGARFLSDEVLGKFEIEVIAHNVSNGDKWDLERMLEQ